MSIVSWLIIGLISLGCILVLSALLAFIQLLRVSRQLAGLPTTPPKMKKKKKRWRALRHQLAKKRKKNLVVGLACLFFGIGSVAAAGYGLYYQSTNLSSDDETSIVRSYYLLRDFQSELEKAAAQSEGEEASQQNIRYLATSLAAYTSTSASTIITPEGQSALNRYYAALAQLGLNATRESANFYGNPTVVESFQADIAKVIEYETAAFEYFKINESALASEGATQDDE